ncbi:hypothetical protein CC78DRAFT_620594 [Lojkania enalia]|uniref:Uncharacterized protein n=1 Tax=Lojkania enalia TaxID=147567 RepID=A0A9P4K0I6_9PLEO|nr:hypothetical protein CC78DRAFT_620594 [Didymosphaeria enalia]
MGGLEFRLATPYKTQSAFGVLKSFFGQSLLWQRSGHECMKPIFDFMRKEISESGEMVKPPSWSWMAYTGGIRYGTFCEDRVDWMTNIDFEYTNHQCILTAPLGRISLNYHITLCGDMDCDIRDENKAIVG